MNKIEAMHAKASYTLAYTGLKEGNGVFSPTTETMNAAHAKVTKDVSVWFAEFMDKGNYFRMSASIWCHPVSLNEYSTEQLFAEFCKTL